ncbi:MAG: Poly(Hydroxyalkanoate) granule-associated protein [Candidatus Magnetoglobus multicellularis str. Araruama]|uniref:Poly(Hydroxyalkanoate) granule-associated protein n=1 Tax=Candidatus Magnetoglobus multicellularis str. Araruama TaxID=890399 RepID=A0A1V1PFX5_9BACT|nr:MAG: Poly(Hydroxyalkanoate) granule-associated protein [Candidatus Magnetoglobus multicellularis str. Araruama]
MPEKAEKLIGEIKESASKIWLAGLGALSMTDGEGSNFFKNLVKKGQDFENMSMDQIKKVKNVLKETLSDGVAERVKDHVRDTRAKAEHVWEKIGGKIEGTRSIAESVWERIEERFEEKIANTLNHVGVPTGEEIAKLTRRVEELAEIVENLKKSQANEESSS